MNAKLLERILRILQHFFPIQVLGVKQTRPGLFQLFQITVNVKFPTF